MLRRSIILLLYVVLFTSCNLRETKKVVIDGDRLNNFLFFEQLKDSFPKKNLITFEIEDSIYKGFYRHFPKIHNKVVDSILTQSDTYLYSWQERVKNPNLIEFTCLTVDEYRGYAIHYFIFDKAGNLVSANKVAGVNGEDGVLFELRSKFISFDTLYMISAVSTEFDRTGIQPYKKLPISKGDSIFYKIIFNTRGETKKDKIFEKNELNYK